MPAIKALTMPAEIAPSHLPATALSRVIAAPLAPTAGLLPLPAALLAGQEQKPVFDLKAAQHNLRKAFLPAKG